MSVDDNDGRMIFGDPGGLKLPDIYLTGEEKPRKTSPRKLVPTRDRTRARCMTSAQKELLRLKGNPFLLHSKKAEGYITQFLFTLAN